MNRTVSILLIVLFAAAPVLAGEKCSYEAQECLDAMLSKFENRGWVGVELDMDEETGALTIKKTEPGSPAEAAAPTSPTTREPASPGVLATATPSI